MLLKLLKYDFRSMGKSLFPVWIACLLIGLVNGYIVPREAGIDMINDRLLSNISVPAFYGILFAMLAAVIVFTVQRFYKGLLGDEGYLMHTLPVPAWQLVLSKLVCAVAVFTASLAVASLSWLFVRNQNWSSFFRENIFQTIWLAMTEHTETLFFLLGRSALAAATLILYILSAYFAMAVGQMYTCRAAASVAALIGLDILFSLYLNVAARFGIFTAYYAPIPSLFSLIVINSYGTKALSLLVGGPGGLLVHVLVLAAPIALLFLGTSYILKTRLNLE